MQDFFFPKMEGDGPDPGPLEHDHSHLFGVQRELQCTHVQYILGAMSSLEDNVMLYKYS